MKLAVPLLLLALPAAGCGGGDRITEARDVAPFERLEVGDAVDVEVTEGEAGRVLVSAGENVIDRVHTESSDGLLRVDIQDRGIVIGPDPLDDVRVQVSADNLDAVRVDGAGDLRLGRIDSDQIRIEVEGSGDIVADGVVERLIATIDGAGDADFSDLVASTAEVTVEGAGDAQLNVTDSLDITVDGAGDVTYRGNPRIQSSIEGAGDLRQVD